jgi:hypothetical protein
MILSLLYDEILVQDQVFVCSTNPAKWFASDDRMLCELFDLDTLKILKRPISEYPRNLQDKAREFPILGRSDEIKERSSNVGEPFEPTSIQMRFHERLDACLKERQSAHKEGGSKATWMFSKLFGWSSSACLLMRVTVDGLRAPSGA